MSKIPESTSSSILTLCIVYTLIHLMNHMPRAYSVKGCVTYVAGDDYSMRQSICDKLNTHFQTIPLSLPSEVIKLTVNHQDITHLNASQFIHLPNLTFLNLDSNKIKVIHPNTFTNLNKLQTLSLRYNFLSISYESFHPNVIHGLSVLQHINLLQNPIGNIPNHFFLPVGKTLRSIVLSGCSTDFHLNTESLYGLYKLQLLDLSNNHMESLPDSYEQIFSQMQLQELYLHGNPWRCDCHLRWLKIWFLKHGSKLIYSKPINEAILRSSIDVEANNWLTNGHKSDYQAEMNAIFQPKCASPIGLHGRPIFSQINNVGIQAVRSTDFHCSPEAYTPDQQLKLIWGSNSTMICKFFADPSGIVVWYKDGIKIQNHWPRITSKQSQGRSFLAELTIENIQSSDTGVYVCYLDTGYGHANTTFNVQVEGGIGIEEGYHYNGVFYWISKLDTTLVLKYTGIIASCLIILLIIMGLLIYFFNEKQFCRPKLSISKGLPTYENRSDQSKKGIGEETETLNSNTCSSNTDKNIISNSKSSYTLQVQNLRVPTSMDGNAPITDKLPTKSEIDNHTYRRGTETGVVDDNCLLPHKSHDPGFENYVTVRLLPTATRGDLSMHCPLHNYAFIHPVSTNPETVAAGANSFGVTLNGVDTTTMQITPDTHLISLSNNNKFSSLENSNLAASLNNLNLCGTIDQQQQQQSLVESSKNRKIKSIISNTTNHDGSDGGDITTTHELNSSVYTPCPLHGNLYATLQTKDRKNISSETRKHIASVPAGLTGLNYEKHHTLPNKKFRTQLSSTNTHPSSSTISRTNTTDIINKSSTSNPASVSVIHK